MTYEFNWRKVSATLPCQLGYCDDWILLQYMNPKCYAPRLQCSPWHRNHKPNSAIACRHVGNHAKPPSSVRRVRRSYYYLRSSLYSLTIRRHTVRGSANHWRSNGEQCTRSDDWRQCIYFEAQHIVIYTNAANRGGLYCTEISPSEP